MTWTVPLTTIAMPEEDVAAVLACLESGWLTMGPRTSEFETAFAEYVGAPYAVAVSSGTAALHLALLAGGVGDGDEVIVPSLTFVAVAAAARYVGARPVFCDAAGPHDFGLDPDRVAASVTPRTKAVVVTHLMGYPADVNRLRDVCRSSGVLLVEDAAQAVGAETASGQVGTVGDMGCYSFFSKNQLCVGEGGMVVTSDESFAASVRRLRSHAMTSVTWDRHRGYAESYDVTDIGFNFRLDEPRAALGISRLGRLQAEIEARRRTANDYRQRLADLDGIELAFDAGAVDTSSHFGFPILLADQSRRDRFRSELRADGIQTTWYPAVTTFTEYSDTGADVQRAESIGERHCVLPLWASMEPETIDLVSQSVARAARA